MADAEPGKPFIDQGATTPKANDAHLQSSENLLALVTEQPRMAIVDGIGALRVTRGRWKQVADTSANDTRRLERDSATAGPDITGNGVCRKYESTNWDSPVDIQQGWIASLMGVQVIGGKPHAVGAAMAMNGQIAEALIRAKANALRYESSREGTIAMSAWDIIDAVFRNKEVTRQETGAAVRVNNAGTEHGSVFITITREKMPAEALVQIVIDREHPRCR